ncbi:hypothetical protein VP01_159g2 [Puccinia sorghi]|uniref:Uncharacterized protein n=1 Tax=Puccinia sorghi TaxID=27349 RepID=A0A0L6VHF0_9BASI|nr:hypothetical protein VP01_159g2 [Puccinia sorghi]
MHKPQIIKGHNCHPSIAYTIARQSLRYGTDPSMCKTNKTGKNNDQVDDKITVMLKVHITHLRLATVANFLDSKSRHVSQWDQIDLQLELLRQQLANYTKHWHCLVSSRDKPLFSNLPPQDKLVNGNVRCPTYKEVLAKMAGHVDVPVP